MRMFVLRAVFPAVLGGLAIGMATLSGCGSTTNNASGGSVTPPAAPLSVSTTSLPAGQVGSNYSAALAAAGGTPPYAWVLESGALPAGLTLSASGTISGTPSAAVTATPVGVQVTDSGSPAQHNARALSLSISAGSPTVTTASLPNGQVGTGYSATLAASGGTPPYHWSLVSGALPAGLTLSPSGAISGTPTATETAAPVGVQVTDSASPAKSGARALTLTIAAAVPPSLGIITTSLPAGEVGVAYSASLSASGGTAPYSWSITAGALAAGLSLSAGGTISGTPTATSGAPVTFKVQDSSAPALSQSAALPMTVNAALVVTTTTLPNAQVGKSYNATLAATGGTPPLSWSLAAGTLPAGLGLSTSGTISGTPTAAVNAAALTFAVADSNVPSQRKTANLTLTVSAASSVSITVTPKALALPVGQTASLTVATNDPSGVTWSVSPSGGSFVPAQSTNGASTTFTAPGTAGAYTITATSISNPAQSTTVALGVTDLSGVYTYRNDAARDGVNGREFALTPGANASVATASFGKLFSCIADGAIYAQPLWVANLTINGAQHNVVFVASAHDSLFAFDADANPCVQLWSVSLIDSAHGANAGEATVPAGPSGYLVGAGYGDITPEVGVIGTPVIDPASGTLYVVSKSMNAGGTVFYQRLHAIDMSTGAEKSNSPTLIQGTYPGTGDGSSTTTFNAQQENQRTGLALDQRHDLHRVGRA